MVTPDPLRAARITEALGALHHRYRSCDEGRVADYIPELSKSNPDCFAISIVTTTGDVFHVGDYEQDFTIQSVSKPFMHGLALADRGRAEVLARVGVEPSGDPFNSIIKLDINNRPHNPMVNAGAIAITGLIAGDDSAHRLDRMLDMFGRYIGRRPRVDQSVFWSERTTGHRNRAMAHLMLNFGVIEDRLDDILDLYFQQCSVVVNADDLAIMAATLANTGVNPITGQRAIDRPQLRDVLTVMHTCGMYNYAGEWAYTVGLPAKSGVSGGIIAVVPGQFGICVYSPPVDVRGNSIRGIRVCEDLSLNAGMHLFDRLPDLEPLLDRIGDVTNPKPELPAIAQTGPAAAPTGHAFQTDPKESDHRP